MPIDHGATESRKRILHWSKRWSGGMSTVVVTAVWLTGAAVGLVDMTCPRFRYLIRS